MSPALKSFFGALAGCAVFFSVQAAVSDKVEVDQPENFSCLPKDEGEKTILWLEPGPMGGLYLHCEKHQVLGYGMTNVPVTVE
jgi:hypothetical protein